MPKEVGNYNFEEQVTYNVTANFFLIHKMSVTTPIYWHDRINKLKCRIDLYFRCYVRSANTSLDSLEVIIILCKCPLQNPTINYLDLENLLFTNQA